MKRAMRQQQENNRISYIKKTMAVHSPMCLTFAAIGLLLFIIGFVSGTRTGGNIPPGGVSVCFSSLLFSAVSIWYGRASLKETDKNYILAKIGTSLGGFLVILWIVMILIGIRG